MLSNDTTSQCGWQVTLSPPPLPCCGTGVSFSFNTALTLWSRPPHTDVFLFLNLLGSCLVEPSCSDECLPNGGGFVGLYVDIYLLNLLPLSTSKGTCGQHVTCGQLQQSDYDQHSPGPPGGARVTGAQALGDQISRPDPCTVVCEKPGSMV